LELFKLPPANPLGGPTGPVVYEVTSATRPAPGYILVFYVVYGFYI
jgi:hypothetical protein